MVCFFRSEVEWYGEYLKFGEYVYDYLFFWGSKCIGFDLFRIGGKYSDNWYFNYFYDL